MCNRARRFEYLPSGLEVILAEDANDPQYESLRSIAGTQILFPIDGNFVSVNLPEMGVLCRPGVENLLSDGSSPFPVESRPDYFETPHTAGIWLEPEG